MKRSLAWNNKGNATVDQVILLQSKGQNVTGLLMGGLRGENRRMIPRFPEARFKEPRGAAPF